MEKSMVLEMVSVLVLISNYRFDISLKSSSELQGRRQTDELQVCPIIYLL